MSLYTDIAWPRRANLTQEELNRRQKIIADVIEELRAFRPDWEAEVAAIREVGLERINDALLPAYQQIVAVSNLGALFSASSESSVEIGTGSKTFVVEEAQRLNFAPTPYVMVYAEGEYVNAMVGNVTSYDSETGVFVVEVESVRGSGTFATWTIGPIATTEDLEALRDVIEAAQADVTAKKAVVDTKHAEVVAIGALYYGALAVAPEDAPLGAQYLDISTTPNLTKVLTSTGWAPTVTVSVGGRRTQDYVAATAGMTGPFSVDGGFSTGDVYVNGVLMRADVDVELIPGESGAFEFAEGLLEGDLVSFRGFLANDATDIYTKAEVDGSRVRFDVYDPSMTPAQQGRAWANIGGSRENDDIIINGCFDVAQRGTSQTGGGIASIDRWGVAAVGGTVTQERVAFTVGDTLGSSPKPFFNRQSVSGQSLATHFAARYQTVESVWSCAGQTITVLGWVRRSSGSGNMAIEAIQNFGTGGSPSSAVFGIGAQQVALSSLWQPFAVTMNIPSITGKTLGTNADDHLAVQFICSAGSNFSARAANLGLQTITIDLFGVHIRKGVVPVEAANYYSPPPIWETEPACFRYYQRFGGVLATSAVQFRTFNYSVKKRRTPDLAFVTIASGTGAALTPTTDPRGSCFQSASHSGFSQFLAAADAEL